MECDLFSALPGLQYYADHAYSTSSPSLKDVAANLRGSSGADFDGFMLASEIDQLPMLADPREMPENCSKWLLWEDPLLGFLHPQLGKGADRAAKHYRQLARKLWAAVQLGGINARLELPARIAAVLSMKVGLHSRLARAVQKRDFKTLKKFLAGEADALQREVHQLSRHHRDLWLQLYKPFGLEVLEGRYGGLMQRLATLEDRVAAFVFSKGEEDIPELRQRLLKIFPKEDVYTLLDHARAATPSTIK
jgi:hypothetical protein